MKSNLDKLRDKYHARTLTHWSAKEEALKQTCEATFKDFKVVIDDFDFKDYVEMGADINSAKLRKHLKEEVKQLLKGGKNGKK